MKTPLLTSHKWYIIWLLMAAIIFISQHSCNSEKRVTKKLMHLDEKGLNDVRPWPHNYTYHEYVKMLDNAKVRQEFYRKRQLQARIAGDKKMAKTMNKNIAEYQKTIDRLESDRQFYKIYRLREKEVLVKLKKEQKTQKDIIKQKKQKDKATAQRKKDMSKKREHLIKERQERLDEKKDRLEDEIEDYENQDKTNSRTLQEKQVELAKIQAIANDSGDANDPNFVEAIKTLEADLLKLENEQQRIKISIETLTLQLEKFIEESYTPKDTVIKSQMILTKDPIPQTSK